MIKYSIVIFLLAISNNMNGQIIEVDKRIDSIPVFDNNRQFMTMVNHKFNGLKSNKADSILLYYRFDALSNYAVIFWKKGDFSQSIAFYQYNPPRQKMGSEILRNETLNKITIRNLFDIMSDKEVRTFDSTYGFEETVIYCKFLFNKVDVILAGYKYKIHGHLSIDFGNAFATEWGRIVQREFKKSGVKRM